MSNKRKLLNSNALLLAAGSVVLGSTMPAWADLVVTRQGSAASADNVWPNALYAPLGGVAPIITANPSNVAGDGSPNDGGDFETAETVNSGPTPDFPTQPYYVSAQTFTPTQNFTLGAISYVASGGGGDTSDPPPELSIHIFQLKTGFTGATSGYQLYDPVNMINNQVGNDLLGGGSGLTYTVPAAGWAAQVTEFDLTNNAAHGGTNDQVALQAGVTYTIETWGLPGDSYNSTFFARTESIDTTPQPYSGGQVLQDHSTTNPDTQESDSPELRGQVVGGGTALDLLFALYPVAGSIQSNPTWASTTGGSWNTSTNWTGGIPDASGATAMFGSAITANSTVTLDTPQTVGAITFSNSFTYTLAPGTAGVLNLNNSGSGGTATIVNAAAGNQIISAPITLVSAVQFTTNLASSTITVSGNISGPNTFYTTGLGTVVLTGSNTWSGNGTQIEGGTVKIGNNAALPTGSPVVLATGAVLDLNGFSPTISTLYGNGTIDDVAGGGTSILTNGSTADSTFSGVIKNTTGSVGINYVGSGVLTLAPGAASGTTSNTFSGGLTIGNTAGTVIIATTGAQPVGGAVVNNGTFSIQTGSTTAVVAGKLTGTGTLQVGVAGGSSGFLQLATGSGPDSEGALSVAAGSTLDITNNRLAINFGSGADPVSTIKGLLTTGAAYNGSADTWTGTGITTSAPLVLNGKTTTVIGYLDGNNTYDAQYGTVAANTVLVKYTVAGDAFLENSVGFRDLLTVAQHYQLTGQDFAHGNFFYATNGSVGFGDLLAVAQSYGLSFALSGESSGGNTLALGFSAPATSAVPEPGSLALVAAGVGGLMARRRRKN